MKWKIDEMASQWNVKLMKWKVNQMAVDQKQVDVMAIWWNDKL